MPLEGIPWQTVGTILTPVGLYMLGFFLLMRGDLIPRI